MIQNQQDTRPSGIQSLSVPRGHTTYDGSGRLSSCKLWNIRELGIQSHLLYEVGMLRLSLILKDDFKELV